MPAVLAILVVAGGVVGVLGALWATRRKPKRRALWCVVGGAIGALVAAGGALAALVFIYVYCVQAIALPQ
jgi:hypothetical protein